MVIKITGGCFAYTGGDNSVGVGPAVGPRRSSIIDGNLANSQIVSTVMVTPSGGVPNR